MVFYQETRVEPGKEESELHPIVCCRTDASGNRQEKRGLIWGGVQEHAIHLSLAEMRSIYVPMEE
jgi:hypothetical protein